MQLSGAIIMVRHGFGGIQMLLSALYLMHSWAFIMNDFTQLSFILSCLFILMFFVDVWRVRWTI